MSKAFISKVLQGSTEVTGAAANRATNDLIDAIVKEDQGPQGAQPADG
jgi:DNA-binding protein HU-beta